MLNIFLRMDLVPKEKRTKVYKQLVGPFRILELFLDIAYKDLKPNKSKVGKFLDLSHFKVDEYVASTYNAWIEKIGSAYSALGVPESFCNHVILLFGFGERLGGKYFKEHDSIIFPAKKISFEVIKWSNSGIIRIQQDGNNWEIFFPYPFLLEYLKSEVSIITKEAVEELFHQIRARWVDSAKGKGYCFQFAVGLELATPTSKLLTRILNMIDPMALPIPKYEAVTTFKSDVEAAAALDENHIAISVDPDSTKKTGDLAFKVMLF